MQMKWPSGMVRLISPNGDDYRETTGEMLWTVLMEGEKQLKKRGQAAMSALSDITPTDAVYGIMAWLTSQPHRVVLSANDNAAIGAEAVAAFLKANNLPDVSERYPHNLTYQIGRAHV